jgi:hypothetical protein
VASFNSCLQSKVLYGFSSGVRRHASPNGHQLPIPIAWRHSGPCLCSCISCTYHIKSVSVERSLASSTPPMGCASVPLQIRDIHHSHTRHETFVTITRDARIVSLGDGSDRTRRCGRAAVPPAKGSKNVMHFHQHPRSRVTYNGYGMHRSPILGEFAFFQSTCTHACIAANADAVYYTLSL